MRIKNNQSAFLSAILSSLLLTACGGGGGGGDEGGNEPPEPTNQAPSVTVAAISIREGESATLKATASDSDGTIASYAWTQKSGVSLGLSGVATDTVSITAPAVAGDASAVLAITVTDDDGAVTTKDVTVSIIAHTMSVTVQGVVTDNPVANAEVSFSVGDQVFSTTADSAGNYSISVAVDDSRTSDMVRAEATSLNARLKLVSLMGTFETLMEAAGEDGIVSREEHLPVNISNLTTALAAQLERGEPGSVSTQEQLAAGKTALDGGQVFHLGALIKLVLDYSDSPGVTMPQDTPDTYALAANPEVAAKLAGDIQKSSPAIYRAALDAMVSDQSLVLATLPDVSAIQDTYYLTTSSLHPVPFDNANNIPAGYRLKIEPQGKGEISGGLGASSLTWAATAAGLEIDGAEFVANTDISYDNNLGQMVEAQQIVRPVLINWLDHGAGIDWILITGEQYTRYPNGEYPPTQPVRTTGAAFAVRDAGTGNLPEALQMGLALSIPLPTLPGVVTDPSPENPQADFDIQAVQLIFAGNAEVGGSVTISQDSVSGTGAPSSTQVSSAWTLDEKGHLRIADVMGYPVELVLLEKDNQKSPLVFVEITDGADKRSTAGKAYLKEAPAWTAASAEGIYRNSLDFFAPLLPFWFEVNADGTALTVSGWDQNQDGELTQDEFSLMPGYWRINDEGNLLIRRYRTTSGGTCQSATWDPAPSEDCVLYHEREWVLHQDMAEDGIGLRHYHRFFMDPFLDRSMGIPEEHTFYFGSIFNTKFERVEERPYAIPSL
ncbi:PKD domain-containing protein [Microbulbifer sp. SA54]|uniref:PKD domain-containing protein n=1 Tax=Microbulbifer sp. SA54 TaxID=3401577 RepID=UPI003AAF776C